MTQEFDISIVQNVTYPRRILRARCGAKLTFITEQQVLWIPFLPELKCLLQS